MNTSDNPKLPNGTILRDYKIQNVLGTGGFGITYLATHIHLHNKVAIKEYMPQEFSRRTDDLSITPFSQPKHQEFFQYGLDRFLHEARDLVRFSHPNIIGASNYFEANGTAYIVMEYAKGYTFEKWLCSLKHPPAEKELKDIFLPLLDGLREVHKHDLLHRDIKPENIYLQEEGSPLLIDFGAARNALGTRSRSLGVVISHGYSPKEQYAAAGHQGAWTDVYSVGACIRRAISGQIPPESTIRADDIDNGESDPLTPAVQFFKGKYSPEFLSTVDWCMALSSRNRPQSVLEVQDCLLGRKHPPGYSLEEGLTNKPGVGSATESRSQVRIDKGNISRQFAKGIGIHGSAENTESELPGVTQARDTTFLIPVLLGVFALFSAGSAFLYFKTFDSEAGADRQVQLQPEKVTEPEQESSAVVEYDVGPELEIAKNNLQKIKDLNVVVSPEDLRLLQSNLNAAVDLDGENQPQLALSRVTAISEQLSSVISTYPRRFRTGSSRESKNQAYELCVESLGEFNCARSWFDAETQTQVDLSPFKLDDHEVTFSEFAEFANQQNFNSTAEQMGWSLQILSNLDVSKLDGFNWRQPEGGNGVSYQQFPDHPVVHVSHRDASEYCMDRGARLPTRAEWEFAMTGGKSQEFATYFQSESVGRFVDQAKVNSLPATDQSLLDTSTLLFGGTGNVWEWTDTPDANGGSRRLLKGGSWNETTAAFVRFAALRPEYQGDSFIDVGFRCAIDLEKWPDGTRL